MSDDAKELATIPEWARDVVARIAEGLQDLNNRAQQLAEIYVSAVDRDSRFPIWLRDMAPGLPARWLTILEHVGRGNSDKRLLLGTINAHRLARLPLSEQRRALDEPIPVCQLGGDHLLVKLENLSRAQMSQVLGVDRLRTLEEQRAWLADMSERVRKNSVLNNAVDKIIKVNRGKKIVEIRGAVNLDISQLNSLLNVHKRGTIREDGFVFYSRRGCVECWVSAEEFDRRIKKERERKFKTKERRRVLLNAEPSAITRPKIYTRGDIRADGFMFYSRIRNRDIWCSPSAFEKKKARARKGQAIYKNRNLAKVRRASNVRAKNKTANSIRLRLFTLAPKLEGVP